MDLLSFQTAVATYLNGLEYFSNASAGAGALPIKVIAEDTQNAAQMVNIAVQKTGIVVILLTPAGANPQKNAPLPAIAPIFIARVIEDVVINRGALGSQETVIKVATQIAAHLHQNQACGAWLVFERVSPVSTSREMAGSAIRDVIFQTDTPFTLDIAARGA